MKKTLTAVALVFMSLSAAQADSGRSTYLPSLDVFYGDLNLSNTYGAAVALKRIKFAATRVCGGRPDSMLDLKSVTQFKGCVTSATREGVSQMKAPLVTALYTGQNAAGMRFAAGN